METYAFFLEETSKLRSILLLQFQCENAGLIAPIASPGFGKATVQGFSGTQPPGGLRDA